MIKYDAKLEIEATELPWQIAQCDGSC